MLCGRTRTYLQISDDRDRLCCTAEHGHRHHFKALTVMSPLQSQKQLRLQEAHRLMLGENLGRGKRRLPRGI
jgi:hypothetical protein